MIRLFLSIVAVCITLIASAEDKVYKIGDYYDDGNGVRGYVFEVSADGKHGKIVAVPIRSGGPLFEPSYSELIEAGIPKSRYEHASASDWRSEIMWCGATSETDGAANTAKLLNKYKELKTKYRFDRRYLGDIDIEGRLYQVNGTTNDVDNNSWYIPALKELESFYAAVAQDNLNQLIKTDIINSNHLGNVGDREFYWNNYLKIPQGFFWSSTQIPNDSGRHNATMWINLDMRDGVAYAWYPDESYWCILIHRF